MPIRISAVAALLLISTACGSSYSPTPGPSPSPQPGTGTPVSIVRGADVLTTTAYSPNPITIAAGGSVTWTNNDNIAHTSVGDGGGWNSGSINAGQTFTTTFPSAGTFRYHCSIHPNMIGTVTVQ